MKKRILSIVLVLVLIFTMMPTMAMATYTSYSYTNSDINTYNRTSSFNHVDVRVNGSMEFDTATGKQAIMLQNVKVTVDNPTGYTDYNVDHSGDNNEDYEWRLQGKNVKISKDAVITVVADIHYATRVYGKLTVGKLAREDFTIVFSGKEDFYQAIHDCDMRQGLDFIISSETLIEAISYKVDYEWEFYEKDSGGNPVKVSAPANFASVPADSTGYEAGENHTVNTAYRKNQYEIDAGGEYYWVFSGWTKYYPADGSGSETSIDGATIPVNSDTTVYGYWVKEELPDANIYLTIDKTFKGDYQPTDPSAVEGLWFILKDNGHTEGADIEYSYFVPKSQLAGGTYDLPIYPKGASQDGTYTFTITEHSEGIDGYTCVTTVSAESNLPAESTGSFTEVAEKESNSVEITVKAPKDEAAVMSLEPDAVKVGTVYFTNTYTKNVGASVNNYPDFRVLKHGEDHSDILEGAVFELKDASGSVVAERTSNDSGYAYFYDLIPGTYTLTEKSAPAGFKVSDKTWTVTVTEDTVGTEKLDKQNNKFYTEYNHSISIDDTEWFPESHHLHVHNEENGVLKLEKVFTGDLPEADRPEITLSVVGEGYSQTVTLNEGNKWKAELSGLDFGEYTVTEIGGDVFGYDLTTTYSGDGKVNLTADNSEASVSVTNDYAIKTGVAENDASFKIKKVDSKSGNTLEGAEFTLYDVNGDVVGVFTTDENGEVEVSGLRGEIGNDGSTNDVEFVLKETVAPTHYELSETEWKVTVSEKDGKIDVVPNQQKGIFESIYDWIVGITPDSTWKDGVLTVSNELKKGSLIVSKNVEYYDNYTFEEIDAVDTGLEEDAFPFKVVIGEETYEFELKDDETKIFENIPYGTAFTVEEVLSEDNIFDTYIYLRNNGNDSLSTEDAPISGVIDAEVSEVDVENQYYYEFAAPVLTIGKYDPDAEIVLAGAEFTLYADKDCKEAVATGVTDAEGLVEFDIPAENAVYYLKETKAPSGYYIDENVYEITAAVSYKAEVDDTIQSSNGTVYYTIYENVTFDSELEKIDDGFYAVPNTAIKSFIIDVQKKWVADEGTKLPEYVEVVLYRDGKEFEKVKLSEKNSWSYEWEVTDEYEWKVDEVNVPSGYKKVVEAEGTSYTITNVQKDIPVTGDDASLEIWATVGLLATAGMAFAVVTLKKKEKE